MEDKIKKIFKEKFNLEEIEDNNFKLVYNYTRSKICNYGYAELNKINYNYKKEIIKKLKEENISIISVNIENKNLLLLKSDKLNQYINKQISIENFYSKSTIFIFISFLFGFFVDNKRTFFDYWIGLCFILLMIFCCKKGTNISVIYDMCNQNAIELNKYTKIEVDNMIKEHIKNNKKFSKFEMQKINKYYDIQEEKIIEKNIDKK